jgi:hypothetical protein
MEKKEKVSIEEMIGSIALGNYLSDWNRDKSYDDIKGYLQSLDSWSDSDPGEVNVWCKFENDDPKDVDENIANLFDDIKNLLGSVLEGVQDGSIQIPPTLELLKTL